MMFLPWFLLYFVFPVDMPALGGHPSGRRKSNGQIKPIDSAVSLALRGADLSSELLPLHTHSSRYYMGFFYVCCVLLVYVLFKLYPANKFRVRKIVDRIQGNDVGK